ncbi:MAG TPA: hypothetical protein VFW73_05415 [Lacipirellulaceae bacterium]|nr:hypothetical protein [Lacipirellulaceae bacterium]
MLAQHQTLNNDRALSPHSHPAVRNHAGQEPHQLATIHWQHVPLREALARLRSVFDESVFVDRRVDPDLRVTLDIQAGSAEDVVAAVAAQHNLGVTTLDGLLYLGPPHAAEQLASVAAVSSREIARLPADVRKTLTQREPFAWPRLSEPRRLITSLVAQHGLRVENAEQIPFDLWAAGELPNLTFAQQLTVLLVGFDLSFDLRSGEKSIRLVHFKGAVANDKTTTMANRSAARSNQLRPKAGTRQVYTLHVQEQPVRAVLRVLSERLHWLIQIDEASIQAAGKSLDTRVSFSVTNADQEHLLDALLKPAGLDYRLEEDRVRIIARRYSE